MKPNPQEHQQQIDAAILKFREWRDNGVACLDTETTSLDGKVWQFALVDSRSLRPALAFDCDPEVPEMVWSDVARSMREAQGVTLAHMTTADNFSEVVRDALRGGTALTAPLVVSWHLEFDIDAIFRTWPNVPYIHGQCAMTAYAPLFGEWSESRQTWKYCSLEKAIERENVYQQVPMPAHTAYGDAVRLALLIEAVAERETSAEQADREAAEAAEQYGDGSAGPDDA